jgi:hypothetical protein
MKAIGAWTQTPAVLANHGGPVVDGKFQMIKKRHLSSESPSLRLDLPGRNLAMCVLSHLRRRAASAMVRLLDEVVTTANRGAQMGYLNIFASRIRYMIMRDASHQQASSPGLIYVLRAHGRKKVRLRWAAAVVPIRKHEFAAAWAHV